MDARFSYREAAVRGASPVRMVIALYEQAVEDLRRAVIAQEQGAIEARTREINHCFAVIAQLQGSLDMERGGEVARNLAKFYALFRRGLVEAQARQSSALIAGQIDQLVTVHEAWLEVEQASGSSAAHAEQGFDSPPEMASTSASGWNA